jgi:hypothetical protein
MIMSKFSFFFLVCIVCACNSTKHSAMSNDNNKAMSDEGWVTLFDGKTTNGWHSYGKSEAAKSWKVENGSLHLDAEAKKKNNLEGGDLLTNEEYGNFDLKLEWKISPLGNSGIIFFVNEDPAKYHETYNTGPEMQVLDNGTTTRLGHPDGKLFTHRAGDLYDLLAAKEAVRPQGEWNQVEVISKNGKLDFHINGQHVLSTMMWDDHWRQMIAISKFKDMPGFGTFKRGKIALQDHGDEVWYRNIRIKKL